MLLAGHMLYLPLYYGSLVSMVLSALTALDSGIMTPWALENVSLYAEYGSVDAAIAAGKSFHMWAKPMLDSYVFLGGTGATLD